MTAPVAAGPAALVAAGLAVVGVLAGAHLLSVHHASGTRLAIQAIAGLMMGIVLQRSRFCFACTIKDLVLPADGRRDSSGVIGLLVAMTVALVGCSAVLSAWIPDPSRGHLPPIAHIGPVGWHLVLGAGIFGLGMAVSGSCISAHLYRLGEGDLSPLAALAGSIVGFVLAYLAWNHLYLSTVVTAPVLWLPALIGWDAAVAVPCLALVAGMAVLLKWYRPPLAPADASPWSRLLHHRWPAWAGGVCVGLIATICLFRGDALGVTAAIAGASRGVADAAHVLPARLEGMDGLRGCGTSVTVDGSLVNGVFIAALVIGAAAAALAGGRFRIRVPSAAGAVSGFLGGILLGFGAMISLGCTVGVLLSGIAASAVSGWLFMGAMLGGFSLGLFTRRWFVRRRGGTG